MQWVDEGLILSVRKHGETSVILRVLTKSQGRHAGLVRGGAGKRLRGILQPGNSVRVKWSGRLEEQLGNFSVDAGQSLGANLFSHPLSLSAASSALALVDKTLPERESHPSLYDATLLLMKHLDEDFLHWGPLFVKWELGLLSELGYGLALDECAATGVTENLAYVSPKSARAVSEEAGQPYHDRLLRLPKFLATEADNSQEIKALDILEGLKLSGYFIHKNLLSHYGDEALPARERFLMSLQKKYEKQE